MGFYSLISMIIGNIVGVVQEMWRMNYEAKAQMNAALMKAAGLRIDDVQDARKLQTSGIQWTRRFLAVVLTSPIWVPAILVLIDANVVFNIPVTVNKGGFSFLFGLISGEGTDNIEYIKVQGYVILTPFIELASYVAGYYFGSKGTQKIRGYF